MADYTPEADASYGLIYRLNYLWGRADGVALTGNLDQWELILDRLFSNLLYREDAEIEVDGKIVKVKFTDKCIKAYEKLKENITIAKRNKIIAIRRKDSALCTNSKLNH